MNCLQPENSFIVTEELRAEAIHSLPSRQLAFGPIVASTPDNTPMFRVQTAASMESAFVTWFTTPNRDTHEAAYLATMQYDQAQTLQMGTGADTSCVAINDQVFASWVYRPAGNNAWNLNVSAISTYDQRPHTEYVCDIFELNTAPEIFLYRGEPTVAALTGGLVNEKARFCFYSLKGREITSVDVRADRNSTMRIASDGARIFAAVLCQLELRVYGFDGTNWSTLSTLPANETSSELNVCRFDMVFAAGQLFIAFEIIGDFNLNIAVIDVRSGAIDEIHPFSMHGKFPSLASNGETVVISWSGMPPLLEGFRTRSHAAKLVSLALWDDADEKVLQQTTKLFGVRDAEDAKLFGSGPWSHLWCATLDLAGHCERFYGPLGFGWRSNWHTQISCHGSNGVMAVLSGGDQDSTCLLARRFSIS